MVTRIVQLADSIPEHAEKGRVVPEIRDPEFRERFVHKYRIIYRVESERILIAAVIHGSRQLEQMVDRIQSVQEI